MDEKENIEKCPRHLVLLDHYRDDGSCWCTDDIYEPSVTPEIYVNSIGNDTAGREHKALRAAADAALVSGQVTWIKNTVGAPKAAVVPVELVEFAINHGYITRESR